MNELGFFSFRNGTVNAKLIQWSIIIQFEHGSYTHFRWQNRQWILQFRRKKSQCATTITINLPYQIIEWGTSVAQTIICFKSKYTFWTLQRLGETLNIQKWMTFFSGFRCATCSFHLEFSSFSNTIFIANKHKFNKTDHAVINAKLVVRSC